MRTTIIFSTAVLAVISTFAFRQSGTNPTPIPPVPISPPATAWPFQTVVFSPPEPSGYEAVGQVGVRTRGRELYISWSYEIPDGDSIFSTQRFLLSYWPTAAQAVEGDLVVAGVREVDGYTVIERWTLSYPPLPQTGGGYEVVVVGTESLYESADPNLGYVRMMSGLYRESGEMEEVLVLYGGGNVLHTLDAVSGFHGEILNSSQSPELASAVWDFITAADHASSGYVYLFNFDPDGYGVDHLALFDADRNGTIDSWQVLDEADWESLGPMGEWNGFLGG